MSSYLEYSRLLPVKEEPLAARRKTNTQPPPVESPQFTITTIERGIEKLCSCIKDLEGLDPSKVQQYDPSVKSLRYKIRTTIHDIFGANSLESRERGLSLLPSPSGYNNKKSDAKRQEESSQIIDRAVTVLKEFILRLEEKRKDLGAEQGTDESGATSSDKPLPKESFKVFYAWQSNRPNNLCRNLIRNALDDAKKQLNNDPDIQDTVEIDQDTQDTPGSPAIADTILQKIGDCSAFVADLTFIATGAKQVTPNPNVLLEYGYALHALGAQRIVGVFNEAFGKPEDLPFDLRYRRFPIRYRASDDSQDEEAETLRREERKKLAKALARAIKAIVTKSKDHVSAPVLTPTDGEDRVREVSRVANEVVETTIYVDELGNKLKVSYDSLFAQANMGGGSAHKLAIDEVDKKKETIGPMQQAAQAVLDEGPQKLADEQITERLLEFEGYLEHLHRVRDKFDRDIASVEAQLS